MGLRAYAKTVVGRGSVRPVAHDVQPVRLHQPSRARLYRCSRATKCGERGSSATESAAKTEKAEQEHEVDISVGRLQGSPRTSSRTYSTTKEVRVRPPGSAASRRSGTTRHQAPTSCSTHPALGSRQHVSSESCSREISFDSAGRPQDCGWSPHMPECRVGYSREAPATEPGS